MKKLFAGILFVALLTAAAGTAFAGGHGGDITETAHVITAAPVTIHAVEI